MTYRELAEQVDKVETTDFCRGESIIATLKSEMLNVKGDNQEVEYESLPPLVKVYYDYLTDRGEKLELYQKIKAVLEGESKTQILFVLKRMLEIEKNKLSLAKVYNK
jgi:hypothetical protein